jgi:hypothetical protein
MGAIAPIKLTTLGPVNSQYSTTDAAVGTNRTFSPERFLAGGVARWVDRSGGIALGYPALSLQIRPPTKDSRVYRITQRIVSPVLETIDPAVGIFGPKLGYSLQSHVEFLLAERSTAAERQALLYLTLSSMFGIVAASDGAPLDVTGAPLPLAVQQFEDVY